MLKLLGLAGLPLLAAAQFSPASTPSTTQPVGNTTAELTWRTSGANGLYRDRLGCLAGCNTTIAATPLLNFAPTISSNTSSNSTAVPFVAFYDCSTDALTSNVTVEESVRQAGGVAVLLYSSTAASCSYTPVSSGNNSTNSTSSSSLQLPTFTALSLNSANLLLSQFVNVPANQTSYPLPSSNSTNATDLSYLMVSFTPLVEPSPGATSTAIGPVQGTVSSVGPSPTTSVAAGARAKVASGLLILGAGAVALL